MGATRQVAGAADRENAASRDRPIVVETGDQDRGVVPHSQVGGDTGTIIHHTRFPVFGMVGSGMGAGVLLSLG